MNSRKIFPLSAAQREIWLAEQLHPNTSAYNQAGYLDIAGTVDVPIFNQALAATLKEAECLRTLFYQHQDKPVQEVLEAQAWTCPFFELQDDENSVITAERWMAEDLDKPVDLSKGPLFGFALFKISNERYLWYFRAHHITIDAYGITLFFSRLAEIYSQKAAGEEVGESPFGSLAMLLDQDELYRNGDSFQRDRQWWHDELKRIWSPHSLADSISSGKLAVPGKFSRRWCQIDAESADKLRQLGRENHCSMAQIVIAIAGIWLSRVYGESYIRLGMPVTARSGRALRSVPGTVSNVLPLSLDVENEMTLLDISRQVAQKTRQILKHQQYRAEDIMRDRQKAAGIMTPLYAQNVNVMVFDNQVWFGDASAHSCNLSNGPTEDLALTIYERGNNQPLKFALDTNDASYTAQDAQQQQRLFQHLLDQLFTQLTQPIASLRLPEWHQGLALIPARNQFSCTGTLATHFEQQVMCEPQATALTSGSEHISYQTLNSRANQLARYLLTQGVRPGGYVAVSLPRSVELIVAILAITKSGAAYLPIDPDYPQQRIDFMLEDAAPVALIVQRQPALLAQQKMEIIALDEPEQRARIDQFSGENIADSERSEVVETSYPAYVIYTSGSTGRPKGVKVSHYNVLRLYAATQQQVNFSRTDVWTLFHSCAFDFAVWEFWGALLHGGRLVLVPWDVSRSPAQFLALLVKEQVTILNQTPSAFQALMLADEEQPMLSRQLALRQVIFGGEALNPAMLESWYQRHDECFPQLVNMYGITETTVHVTWQPLYRADCQRTGVSPIGKPLDDLAIYLLDQQGDPVATGQRGEIYVSGGGVAQGYLKLSGLTADRFLPDPFQPNSSRLMYRSGDLARLRQDGVLEFLGRSDEQVKIRGYRIEIGEVVAALKACHGVRQAEVIVHDDCQNVRTLLGYVIAEQDSNLNSIELRTQLSKKLPEHMVPADIILLENFPLTVNGKLDRKALMEIRKKVNGTLTDRALTPIETELHKIFCELLGVESVAPRESFFKLGGESLLAMRLNARLQQDFNVDIALREFFQNPCLEQLALLVEEKNQNN